MSARKILTLLFRAYKRWVSPWLPPACRFEPTCSVYAIDAIELYGAGRGTWMAVCRVGRCHPFSRGGFDPVPPLADIHASAPEADSRKAGRA